ncbi:hypothetical protein HI914_03537 [Erysiphe necator]|nr:hypothetical protein HI914_03537 [Erysiphe necator]
MHIEKNLGCKIKFCRLDGESTFGHKFRDFMADRAIYIERTAPDTSEQNGGLESSGGVIVIKTRSFIIGAALPSKLWIEAFNSATYIKNRTPHRHLDWKTPYKATFRVMMSIAAAFDLDIKQYDAVNAFSNAKLPHPVYCKCAEGY